VTAEFKSLRLHLIVHIYLLNGFVPTKHFTQMRVFKKKSEDLGEMADFLKFKDID